MKKLFLAFVAAIVFASTFAAADVAILYTNATGASDGFIEFTGAVYTRSEQGAIRIGLNAVTGYAYRSWFIFNLSSIPNNAQVSEVNITINTSTAAGDRWCGILLLDANASAYSDNAAGNADFYSDIANGTDYTGITYFCTSAGTSTLTLSAAAADLQNALSGSDLFGLGVSSTEDSTGSYGVFESAESATAYRPYLSVAYTSSSDTTAPAVALDSPSTGAATNNATAQLRCTPTDNSAVSTVQLYGNWSGWHRNQTNTSGLNNTQVIFTANLTPGTYLWNCRANDTGGSLAFASSNFTIIVDRTAPTASSNSTNSTAAGQIVEFRLYWVDSRSALNYFIFSFDNGTGAFTNDTPVALSGALNWSNVTKTINATNGSAIQWRVYANDSAGNLRASSIYSFTAIRDITPPTPSANSTSTTAAAAFTDFRLYWSDDVALSYFIFSFDNGTGTFTNDTPVALSGASNWSNVTKYVNQTVGSTIRWVVYANDSAGNLNASPTYSHATITDASAPRWANNATSTAFRGTPAFFTLSWTDDSALAGYVFSFDNGFGSFTNDSYVSFTGASNTSNVSKTLNSTYGITIRWRVFANDTSGKMNVTPNFTLVTTNSSNTPPAMLSVQILPNLVYTNTPLNCSALAVDGENSSLRINFTWHKNRVRNATWDTTVITANNTIAYANRTVNSTNTLKNGDSWTCSAFANDGNLTSAWANSSPKSIGGVGEQTFHRISLDCPPSAFNRSVRLRVAYYEYNELSCAGYALQARYGNGTLLPANSISGVGCEAGNRSASFNLRLPASGDYVVEAKSSTISGVTATCAIAYRQVQVLPTRVPELHPVLAVLIAFAALFLLRRNDRK